MSKHRDRGYLKVLLGPMFSGKTSELIRIFKRYKSCDINCCVINHIDDTRYDKDLMSSHSKEMIPCYNYNNLLSCLEDSILNEYDVFLINEGQFFIDLNEAVDLLVNKYHKTLYVCGLDGDFKRNEFGQNDKTSNILKLIPNCDDVVKLKSICKLCKHHDGIFTHRLSHELTQKLVGNTNYIPLCRKCYLKNNTNNTSKSEWDNDDADF